MSRIAGHWAAREDIEECIADVLVALYGSAVDQQMSADDITVRVEAAYANRAEAMVALTFEDAQGRLDEGMGFAPTLSGWFVGSSGSSFFTPKMMSDGRLSFPVRRTAHGTPYTQQGSTPFRIDTPVEVKGCAA